MTEVEADDIIGRHRLAWWSILIGRPRCRDCQHLALCDARRTAEEALRRHQQPRIEAWWREHFRNQRRYAR